MRHTISRTTSTGRRLTLINGRAVKQAHRQPPVRVKECAGDFVEARAYELRIRGGRSHG